LEPDKCCPIPTIADWWSRNKKRKVSNLNVPIDDSGLCLFHSKDAAFKEANAAIAQFRILLEAYRLYTKEAKEEVIPFDFDEFVFVGSKSEFAEVGDQTVIDLSDLRFPLPASFRLCEFHDEVWFNGSTFGKSVQFHRCRFAAAAHFENATFDGRVDFSRSVFASDAGFREAEFKGQAYFSDCDFSGATAFNETLFRNAVDFRKSSFERLYFHRVTVEKGSNDAITSFEEIEIKDSAEFRDTTFLGELSFKTAKLQNTEFVDVIFSPNRVTKFDRIQVNGSLMIKSLTEAAKTFGHSVSFDVQADDIKGAVIFENANIFYITQLENLKKLADPAARKVVIGQGCDKYRLRVEFTIPLEDRWRFLVEELAETFVIYFDWRSVNPIGISCECEYSEEGMLVRYFADADITQEKFSELIAERVPGFMALLKDPQNYIQARIFDSGDSSGGDIVKHVDLLRKAWSLLLGFIPRLRRNDLSEDHFIKLLEALGKGGNTIQLKIELHQRLSQMDIFSVNTRKFLAGQNLTIDDQSE